MIQYYQAVILGLLQGFSELFPISSLGHSVILPKILGWNIQENDKFFLNFLVATHLATALVLLGFFRRDWVRIVKGLARSLRDRQIAESDSDARLGWLLVALVPVWGSFADGVSVALLPIGAATIMCGVMDHRSLVRSFGSPHGVEVADTHVGG